ncbi:MAG: hypothetical protein LBK52_06595, partial [Deltaproteobacteria bacterium]|nr:hypothetical protein [Deltaproteobacteria bacterium]
MKQSATTLDQTAKTSPKETRRAGARSAAAVKTPPVQSPPSQGIDDLLTQSGRKSTPKKAAPTRPKKTAKDSNMPPLNHALETALCPEDFETPLPQAESRPAGLELQHHLDVPSVITDLKILERIALPVITLKNHTLTEHQLAEIYLAVTGGQIIPMLMELFDKAIKKSVRELNSPQGYKIIGCKHLTALLLKHKAYFQHSSIKHQIAGEVLSVDDTVELISIPAPAEEPPAELPKPKAVKKKDPAKKTKPLEEEIKPKEVKPRKQIPLKAPLISSTNKAASKKPTSKKVQ